MVSISSRFLVLELLLIKVKSTFKCYTTTINTHIRLTLIEVNWGKGQNNLLVFANNVGSCQMWLACSTAESEVMRQSLRKVQKSVTGQLSSNFSYFQRDRREKLGSAAASPSVFWPCWVSTPCLHSPALTLPISQSERFHAFWLAVSKKPRPEIRLRCFLLVLRAVGHCALSRVMTSRKLLPTWS